jgi:hypothetical protein
MLRYYVYVSETKVEQLYAQIPLKLRDKVAAKLTIDLKLIKGEVERRQPQESLFSKLDIVREYLENEGLIGTADDPKSFFGEIMPLSWDTYLSERESARFAYFGGRTKETVIGLGGSFKHIIAGPTVEKIGAARSGLPFLREALSETLKEEETASEAPLERTSLLKDVVRVSRTTGKAYSASMEFVAKRLIDGIVNPVQWFEPGIGEVSLGAMKVLLGTPLYVAMAE